MTMQMSAEFQVPFFSVHARNLSCRSYYKEGHLQQVMQPESNETNMLCIITRGRRYFS